MRSIRVLSAAGLTATLLSECCVVPVIGPDGRVFHEPSALPPPGMVAPAQPAQGGAMPAVLNARLYPSNELTAQTGVISGTVTKLMTSKGRFEVICMGEVLTGEATRVSNDDKRDVASAYSPKGMYMSCEYQMNTPLQGAARCTFANGVSDQLHLGGA